MLILPVAFVGVVLGGSIFAAYKIYVIYDLSDPVQERKAQKYTQDLYQRALATQPHVPRDEEVIERIVEQFPLGLSEETAVAAGLVAKAIYDGEQFLKPIPKPPPICNSVPGAKYREFLIEYTTKVHEPLAAETAIDAIAACPRYLLGQIPRQQGTALATVPLEYFLPNIGKAVQSVISPFFDEEVERLGLFQSLRRQLTENLYEASDIPLDGRSGKAFVLPEDYQGDDIPFAYLKNTPLLSLFDIEVPIGIPQKTRYEHHALYGGTGHGKTSALEHLIAHDLDLVAAGKASVIVIDSQGDLIDRKLARLDVFAEGGPLEGKLVHISPKDVDWPLALNLFDVDMARINKMSPLHREQMINRTLELYEYIFSSLLSAALTQRQGNLFRFCVRLMFQIPNATIHSFHELFQEDGYERFKPYIDKMQPTERAFFEKDFRTEYNDTKKQIVRRLWGIIENTTFNRMFSHPKSKLDLAAEMDAGKVILIDTAQDLLQKSGTEFFGRFFIALISQAVEARAAIPEEERLPCFVYIDEFGDYAEATDKNITTILRQARKRKVGMVVATQMLGDLSAKTVEALNTNTSIKFVGGTSVADSQKLARDMRTTPEFIARQPALTFAAFIKGTTDTAIPLTFSYGHLLKKYSLMTDEQFAAIRDEMRENYATHYGEAAGEDGAEPEGVVVTDEGVVVREEDGMGATRADDPDHIDTDPR